jgi:hypothetical protein
LIMPVSQGNLTSKDHGAGAESVSHTSGCLE